MYSLKSIEEVIKNRFSYELSSSFPENPLIYLSEEVYRDLIELEKFKDVFDKLKASNSKLPFMQHHIRKYNGDLPIWVAIEIMTMGNINKLYSNLKTCYQKPIAYKFNTGTNQLCSWINNITHFRNHLAHYGRLYNYNFIDRPVMCNKHIEFVKSGKVFNQVLLVGFLFPNKEEWMHYIVAEITKTIEEFSEFIELKDIGFPKNWKNILLSI